MIFTGDCTTMEAFMLEWQIYMMINNMVEIMRTLFT